MLLLFLIPIVTAINLPLPSFISDTLVSQKPLDFPQWLTEFTGLHQWPGLDPPYIPLNFIDFSMIESNPHHIQGDCGSITPDVCSFDCRNCIAFDDICSCPQLSQTFDDGPSPGTTKLVNQLKTKSTFFTLGVNVIKYPDTYQKLAAKGHVMGSHTWSHKFLPSLSNEEIIAQIEWSIWAMNATGNHLPKWFRPPYGGLDNRVRSIVRQFGMQNVLWNFDTFDWKMAQNAKLEVEIYKEVQEYKTIKNKQGIILEHDSMMKTVDVGIEINKMLPQQMTIPQCVGGIDYIKTFS